MKRGREGFGSPTFVGSALLDGSPLGGLGKVSNDVSLNKHNFLSSNNNNNSNDLDQIGNSASNNSNNNFVPFAITKAGLLGHLGRNLEIHVVNNNNNNKNSNNNINNSNNSNNIGSRSFDSPIKSFHTFDFELCRSGDRTGHEQQHDVTNTDSNLIITEDMSGPGEGYGCVGAKKVRQRNRTSITDFFPVVHKPSTSSLFQRTRAGKADGNSSVCGYCSHSPMTVSLASCSFCGKSFCEDTCGGICRACGESFCGRCSSVDMSVYSHEYVHEDCSTGSRMDMGMSCGGNSNLGGNLNSSSMSDNADSLRICIDCQHGRT